MDTIDKKNRVAKINIWKPKPRDIAVEPDGKLFVCHFDRFYPDANPRYNRFLINKGSYENQLSLICRYANFFISNYDSDMELVTAYYELKYLIDGKHKFGSQDMNRMIEAIYEIMFTPTMVDKITKMVRDNYLDDIESPTEEKKKYLKNDRKHLESLEFTNMHIKILHRISFGIKIMSPVLFHYLSRHSIKIEKDSEILYDFYKDLFDIFGWGEDYELCDLHGNVIDNYEISEETLHQKLKDGIIFEDDRMEIDGVYVYRTAEYDDELCSAGWENGEVKLHYWRPQRIEMYNKLYVYVKAKVQESCSHNSIIFDQREIFGVDLHSVVNMFTKKVLIGENMVKYKFNEHWSEKKKKYDENIIGFNKTIIKFQIGYFLKDQYVKNLTEVTNTKNSEGLSGSDKLMMNLTKLDEGIIDLAEINIDTTIEYIKKQFDIEVTDIELDYYREHLNPSDIQIELVYAMFAPYFGSHRDLKLLGRREYLTLLLLLKKKLLVDLAVNGYSDPATAALPYMLTANVSDKVSTRTIRNNKFLAKLESTEDYQRLLHGKYRYVEEIKPGYINSLLSSFINTEFRYVIAEAPMLLNEPIVYNEDKISDEILYFLKIA